ncbi:MAG TPA: Flp family type IVb pilin [Caulobacteraceae bacterium]|jgi:pilus assembly protein Flp/PilA|nr:Flp family type IVb pilin [Caulobacteraceae bacterium]
MTKLVSFVRDESGASAAEYALILAVVCAAIAAALVLLKGAITNATNSATSAINTNTPAS